MRGRLDLGYLTMGVGALGVGLVAYHALLDHSISQGVRDTLHQVGLESLLPSGSGPQAIRGAVAGSRVGAQTGSLQQSCDGAADDRPIIAANPSYPRFSTQWKAGWFEQFAPVLGYVSNGYDWPGFRKVMLFLGQPDPGPLAPVSWCR